VRVVVSRLADFPPDERRIVSVDRRSIGVFRVGDDFYAVRNRCPHQGGPLCLGRVFRGAVSEEPGRVEYADEPPLIACPWHGWEYDLATGQSFAGRSEPLRGRFDKDWKSVWREVPWVKEKPSVYVRRHFRATIQPANLPADRDQVAELVQMVGSEWLLHASDHPHHHGPGVERLFDVLDGPATRAVLSANAESFYRID
jgi:nitrite reductase/ring-hydroxylating ferredoxin subunit